MKILYLANIPSPYRVDYYNELGKTCELTVLFETDASLERDNTWKEYHFANFRGIVMKGLRVSVDMAFCPGVTKYLKTEQYDVVVLTVLASPTAILAAHTLQRRRIPYFYEGDGGFAGKSTGLKSKIKRYIISNAYKCFSTSEEFDRYCMTYGARRENLLRYPFTSVRKKELPSMPPGKEERRRWKREFGIREECAVVSVGQFIRRKGFDLLLECCRDLPEEVGIYIVGGKPTEEYLVLCERYHLKQVHFMEFMPRERLMQFYKAMDLFVLFTREDIWGLVVNEAMANGLPVISTDRCIAALELIRQGENGFLVETENLSQMREALHKLVSSEELRERMSGEAIRTMERYTIENMAEEHRKVFAHEGKLL
mgnify:CR=1 FL=1